MSWLRRNPVLSSTASTMNQSQANAALVQALHNVANIKLRKLADKIRQNANGTIQGQQTKIAELEKALAAAGSAAAAAAAAGRVPVSGATTSAEISANNAVNNLSKFMSKLTGSTSNMVKAYRTAGRKTNNNRVLNTNKRYTSIFNAVNKYNGYNTPYKNITNKITRLNRQLPKDSNITNNNRAIMYLSKYPNNLNANRAANSAGQYAGLWSSINAYKAKHKNAINKLYRQAYGGVGGIGLHSGKWTVQKSVNSLTRVPNNAKKFRALNKATILAGLNAQPNRSQANRAKQVYESIITK